MISDGIIVTTNFKMSSRNKNRDRKGTRDLEFVARRNATLIPKKDYIIIPDLPGADYMHLINDVR